MDSEILDRRPPFDLDAEMAVLGSIILHGSCCDEVELILTDEDFYDDANRRIFKSLRVMRANQTPIDGALLVSQLKSSGDFEAAGGIAYIFKVSSSVPNHAHAIYYARIVREKSVLRSIINAGCKMISDAYEESDADSILATSEASVFAIRDRRNETKANKASITMPRILERIEARIEGGGDDVVSTGYSRLDTVMAGGLRRKNMIILAARPSMGKTAFACNIADYVARILRKPVLFVTVEMSEEELLERMISSISGVRFTDILQGTISPSQKRKLVDAATLVKDSELYIVDCSCVKAGDVAAHARRVKRQAGGLDLMVLDYIQLVDSDTPTGNATEDVAKVSKRMKGIAKELDVPLLALAQLNREADATKDHRPRLSHLKQTGQLEQDADVVWFVHRDSYYLKGIDAEKHANEASIIIAKQRNGMVCDVELTWDSECVRFIAPHSHYEEVEAMPSYTNFGDYGGEVYRSEDEF